MNYVSGPRMALTANQRRCDFSVLNHLTKAYAMVDQRDTADVRFAHMEKRANKDEVPAQESIELPCSESSWIGLESSDMFGILPAQQPPQTQTNHKTRGG